MADYVTEDDVWKCPKHPSRRRKTGICPTCLRERLVTLCPECANLRPCSNSCAAATTSSTSSSSSSSSSSSIFSFRGSRREPASAGEVGRISNLIETEPVFRKSRSLAIPFLRSRSKFVSAGEFSINKPLPPVSRSKISFWSVFKLRKVRKGSDDDEKSDGECKKIDELAPMNDYSVMMRSRSVAIGVGAGLPPPPEKRRGWYFYFPSPMKFRSSKTSKVVQERSP